jgi:hypothetical protein
MKLTLLIAGCRQFVHACRHGQHCRAGIGWAKVWSPFLAAASPAPFFSSAAGHPRQLKLLWYRYVVCSRLCSSFRALQTPSPVRVHCLHPGQRSLALTWNSGSRKSWQSICRCRQWSTIAAPPGPVVQHGHALEPAASASAYLGGPPQHLHPSVPELRKVGVADFSSRARVNGVPEFVAQRIRHGMPPAGPSIQLPFVQAREVGAL